MPGASEDSPQIVGRYAIFGKLAAGGMATVQLGRMMGPAGFSRVVAMKRMHPQFARDPEFVTMFLDEARLAARVRHPNVVSSTDVVAEAGELFIVMEYVEGEALSGLLKLSTSRGELPPPGIVVAIVVQALHGLHAAHEAKSEAGMPLGIVHRDVSPQNVLVGADGLARVVDFGIARAAGRAQHHTQDGVLKGKVSYMAPEQIRSEPVDRRVDVYAAGVVLWESLTGRRLYKADSPLETFERVLKGGAPPPSTYAKETPPGLDAAVLRALALARDDRFATALDFADALEQALAPASPRAVGKWVETVARKELALRARLVSKSEGSDPAGTAMNDLDAPTSVDPEPPIVTAAAIAEAPALLVASARAPAELDLDAPTIERTDSVPARRAPVVPGARTTLPLTPSSGPPGASSPLPHAPVRQTSTLTRTDPLPARRVVPADAIEATSIAEPDGKRRAKLAGLAILGAILLLGGVVVALLLARGSDAETASGDGSTRLAASARAPSSDVIVSLPAPREPSSAASSITELASAAPSAVSAPSATSAAPSAVSAPSTSPQPTVGVAHPTATADPRCNPPFYYDEKHLKRFKPGCVR